MAKLIAPYEKRRRARSWLIAGCAALLVLAPEAFGATLTVTTGADSGTGTLRKVLLDASSGDTIDFAPGVSSIDLTTAELAITKNLTINGPGASLLTVRRATSGPAFRIFRITGGVTAALSGLTVAVGITSDIGGGIFTEAGNTLNLSDAAVINSWAFSGGGIANLGTTTLVNTTVSGNVSIPFGGAGGGGGGIYNHSQGNLALIRTTVSGNQAANSGQGILSLGQVMTIRDSTISGNTGGGARGGGIAFDGGATITNTTITGNSGGSQGGGIWFSSGTLSLKNSIVALNTGSQPDIGSSAVWTSQGFNLVGNNSGAKMTAAAGDQIGTPAAPINPLLGPLQNNGGPTTTHALLSGSPAIDAGKSDGFIVDQRGLARPVVSPVVPKPAGGDGSDIGAYEVQADILPGCSGVNRRVANGNDGGTDSLRDVIAKVCPGSTITFAPGVTAVTLTTSELLLDKSLTISGPGARVLSVQRSASQGTPDFRIFRVTANVNLSMSGLTVSNGRLVDENGAGIENSGTLLLTGVVVSGNKANAAAAGAGIFNRSGTLTLTRSTVSDNGVGDVTAAGIGGGVVNSEGTLTITESTISRNSALGSGASSGGLFNIDGVTNLVNSTITGNSADNGGGLRTIRGSLNLRNTIVALNTAANGPDIHGAVTSQGFNIVGVAAGGTIAPVLFTDQIGVTAAQLSLGLLQDNGGATPTHALLAGSSAIDKGHSSNATTDQRGFARVTDVAGIANAGDGADVGAFERIPRTLDIDGNNAYDALTDGLVILRYMFGLTGPALTAGAIGPSPSRSSPADILQYLGSIRPALDVDGNTQVDALSDGLILLRYLFGLRGAALTAGAMTSGATRTTAQIEAYIQTLLQ